MTKDKLNRIWIIIAGMSMFACVMAIIYALFGVFAAAIYGVFNVVVLAFMIWELHKAIRVDE
jgi:predicted membrane protein